MTGWLEVLLLIAAVYLLVKIIQGIRDFVTWYQEGRAFAAEQKRVKALRRQQRSAGDQHARPERTADGFVQAADSDPQTATGQQRDNRDRLKGDPETAEVNRGCGRAQRDPPNSSVDPGLL